MDWPIVSKNRIIRDDILAAIAFYAVVVTTAVFLISPILMIIPMSFSSGRYLEFPPPGWSLQWYREFFADPAWKSSLWTSVEVASLATVLSLGLGMPAAFALVRSKLRQKTGLLALLSLPLVFPVIALAVALYYIFSQLHLVGTPVGLGLAHTVLALPVVILPTVAALQYFDYRLEWQAINLGASRWQVLRTVTVPLMLPVLITVTLFAFVTSFDEVVIAIFLSGGDTVTLPVRIWEGLRFEIQPTVTVVATFLLLISAVVISLIALLQRRAGLISSVRKEPMAWKPVA